jgi:hypothetical protein
VQYRDADGSLLDFKQVGLQQQLVVEAPTNHPASTATGVAGTAAPGHEVPPLMHYCASLIVTQASMHKPAAAACPSVPPQPH